MSLKRLATIGYEGASIPDFLATLKAAGVTMLLDVREFAGSRRKGFAKTALRQHLASVGIDYRHEPALGSPRDIRNQLREDPVLLTELDQTLAKPHLQPVLLRSQTSASRLLTDLQILAELIDPPGLSEPVSRDPDDDHVLACALAGNADLIITGDQDLLVLHPWRGIPILTVSQALEHIAAGTT